MSIAVLIEAAEFLERRERGEYLFLHFFRSLQAPSIIKGKKKTKTLYNKIS